MGDENPICTLGDYSKPSHEGYRNTIKLPLRNNAVPLRFDTIRLVQNGCSFQGLRFEDPNQHFKDFLKLVDSLDLEENEAEEEGSVEPNKTNRINANETDEDVESKKEVEEETKGETEEEEEDNPEHFDTFPTMKELRKFLIKNEEEIFTDAGDGVRIYPDGIASPPM
ncbi:hypothetical protein Tco_0551594 [Tanacetum coccineum]